MEVELFVCADSAAVDARTQTISLFHIIEELNSPAFPVVIPRLTIGAVLTRVESEPERPDLQLRIGLGSQEIFRGPFGLSFQQHLRARAIVDIQGVVVLAPGSLKVALYAADRELAAWSIKVNHIGQPAVSVQPALV